MTGMEYWEYLEKKMSGLCIKCMQSEDMEKERSAKIPP